MITKAPILTAKWSQADCRVVAIAAEANLHHQSVALKSPIPLAYFARKERLSSINHLRERERMLRIEMERLIASRVALTPKIECLPILQLYTKKGIIPPPAIRILMSRLAFYLLKVEAKLAASAHCRILSLRWALEFADGTGRTPVYNIFPTAGVRRFGPTEVLVMLRSNLCFWIAQGPGSTLITRPERIPQSVRDDSLFGPIKYSFRKVAVSGLGAGRSLAEWYLSAQGGFSDAQFTSFLVLCVPKAVKVVRLRGMMDAKVETPALLQPLLGKHRFLSDARHWQFKLA